MKNIQGGDQSKETYSVCLWSFWWHHINRGPCVTTEVYWTILNIHIFLSPKTEYHLRNLLSTKERYINYGCLCSWICFTVLIWNSTQSIILSYSHTILFDTDYIKYWLGSIHTYSSREAPVIVALSHAEDNKADPKKVCLYKLMSMKILIPNWKHFLVLNCAFKCKPPEITWLTPLSFLCLKVGKPWLTK